MVYHIDVVDPTPADVVGYSPGDEWENTVKVTYFRLYAIVGGLADWRQYTKPVLKEQRLSGDNPLSYLGVEPSAPFKFVRCSRNPTTRDNSLAGFTIGDEWENEFTGDVWKLVDVSNNIGTWVLMGAAVGTATELRPDVGPLAAPDVTHAINLLGGTLMYTISLPNTIEVNHNAMATGQVIIGATAPAHAAMNRITQGTNIVVDDLTVPGAITLSHEAPDGFTNLIDNAATVVPFDPATHGISILGTVGIRTYRDPANVNRLIISTERANNGELFTGRTGDVPLWKVINPGVNVGVVNQPGMITLTSSVAGGDVTFVADTNVATSVGGVMDFVGGANINTVGDTVQEIDINLKDFITLPNTNAIGTEGLFTLGVTPFVSNYNNNVFLGGAGSFLLNGTGNTMIGIDGGSVLTTGSNNSSLGQNALDSLTSGSNSIGIGESAGTMLTVEDSNIYINNDGTVGDAHTLRIGDQLSPDKSLASAYIDGIYQAPVDYSTAEIVINDANDKLGSISMSDLRNLIPVSGEVVKIVNGKFHTCILLTDGSVWCAGDNQAGQLGLGDLVDRHYFTKMIGEGASGCTDIAAGWYGFQTFVLKGDRLYGCGNNSVGMLGDGTTTVRNVLTPAIGHGASGVTAIASGAYHTVILKGDVAYSTGYNYSPSDLSYGQLGLGTTTSYVTQFTPMVGFGTNGCTAIAAGYVHTLVLRGDAVYGTGFNYTETVGLSNASVLGTNTKTPYYTQLTPMVGQGTAGCTAISTGYYHSIVLKGDAVYGTGVNHAGQIGNGTLNNAMVLTPMIGQGAAGCTAIYSGPDASMVLKGNALYGTGPNFSGNIGDGTLVNKSQLTPSIGFGTSNIVGFSTAYRSCSVIRNDGNVYSTGTQIKGYFGDGVVSATYTQLTPAIRTW